MSTVPRPDRVVQDTPADGRRALACVSPATVSYLGLCVCRWLAVVVHLSAMARVRALAVVSMRVMASASR
jgi:hypothetical protein